MYKINVYTKHEAYLTPEQEREIARNVLRSMISPGQYIRYDTIKNKVWLKQDDPEWRHGSVSEEIVREATELDIAVCKVLYAIEK